MVAANQVNVIEMARRFAEAVKDEPAARALWFRQLGSIAELWLVTDPVDLETETRIRKAGRLLFTYFPDALIDFQLINPALSASADQDPRIPADAHARIIH
jgi:hypothetical protein